MKNARYSIPVPYLDSSGTPTDPTTPDTEVSKDAGAFADCTEEVTTITGSNGAGYITLTGAETDCSLLVVVAKVASGPKNTILIDKPRVLPILLTGTASAGGASSITLAAGAYDLTGCIVRTTGGTGGGGTGGANNQARVITAYNTSTLVATVEPSWETNPDNTTTYDILLTELACNSPVTRALRPTTDGRTLDVASTGEAGLDFNNILSSSLITLHSLTVTNTTTLSGAVSLGSTLGVTGATTLAAVTTTGTVTFNALTVSGATTLAAVSCTTLTASGAVAFQSTLTITGTTTFTGAITGTNASNDLRGITPNGAGTLTEAYAADGAAFTHAQALYEICQRLTEFSIAGTTITVKKRDGSTTAFALTMDSSSTPTSSTRSS